MFKILHEPDRVFSLFSLTSAYRTKSVGWKTRREKKNIEDLQRNRLVCASPRTRNAKPQSPKKYEIRYVWVSEWTVNTHIATVATTRKKKDWFKINSNNFDMQKQPLYDIFGAPTLCALTAYCVACELFARLFNSINIQFSFSNFRTGCKEKSVWHSPLPFFSLQQTSKDQHKETTLISCYFSIIPLSIFLEIGLLKPMAWDSEWLSRLRACQWLRKRELIFVNTKQQNNSPTLFVTRRRRSLVALHHFFIRYTRDIRLIDFCSFSPASAQILINTLFTPFFPTIEIKINIFCKRWLPNELLLNV